MKHTKLSLESLLKEWDLGSKSKRAAILKTFITECSGKTAPELEERFSSFASLFFARLTSWLRISYIEGTCLQLQLHAIAIFVSAASGQVFVTDFLQVGGVQTILEILGIKKASEASKIKVLQLLQHIAKHGRSYKEFICECHGIRAIAECFAKSTSLDIMEEAKQLLQTLFLGNPSYQTQTYNVLVRLLKSALPSVQHTTLQLLCFVQPIVGDVSPAIVEPLLLLLRTLHVEVRHEVNELVKLVIAHGNCQALLQGLVMLMKPQELLSQDTRPAYLSTPLPVFAQQSAAAKLVGILAKEVPNVTETLIQLDVVHHLLFAMGNDRHADAQCNASVALEFFMRTNPSVDEVVKQAVGGEFYQHFLENPAGFCLNLSTVQLQMLRQNKAHIVTDDSILTPPMHPGTPAFPLP